MTLKPLRNLITKGQCWNYPARNQTGDVLLERSLHSVVETYDLSFWQSINNQINIVMDIIMPPNIVTGEYQF